MKLSTIGLIAAGVAAVAGPAAAHHSGAMFDSSKTVVLEATVKELQWTNPHMWLEVYAPGPDGKPVQWGFEMIGTNVMHRQGWNKDTVNPGDHVTVIGHPLRDGRPGASYVGIKLANGKTLGCAKTDGTRCVRAAE
jgi:hypothetical protein